MLFIDTKIFITDDPFSLSMQKALSLGITWNNQGFFIVNERYHWYYRYTSINITFLIIQSMYHKGIVSHK